MERQLNQIFIADTAGLRPGSAAVSAMMPMCVMPFGFANAHGLLKIPL